MADSPRPVLADSGVWFDLYNGKSTQAALLLAQLLTRRRKTSRPPQAQDTPRRSR